MTVCLSHTKDSRFLREYYMRMVRYRTTELITYTRNLEVSVLFVLVLKLFLATVFFLSLGDVIALQNRSSQLDCFNHAILPL